MGEKPTNRVYHGRADHRPDSNSGGRVFAMNGGTDPTGRERARKLYELDVDQPAWWGYTGGSPSRTAKAIVEDIFPDVLTSEQLDALPRDVRTEIVTAFNTDFMGCCHDETQFWISASAAQRWLRGWLAELEQQHSA